MFCFLFVALCCGCGSLCVAHSSAANIAPAKLAGLPGVPMKKTKLFTGHEEPHEKINKIFNK